MYIKTRYHSNADVKVLRLIVYALCSRFINTGYLAKRTYPRPEKVLQPSHQNIGKPKEQRE